MQARHVGQIEQAHAGLFGQTIPFAAIAASAGSDAIHPTVAAAP